MSLMSAVSQSFPVDGWPLVVAFGVTAAYLAAGGFRRRDWLHPLAGPLLYVAIVMIVPLVYVHGSGVRLGPLLPGALLDKTVQMMAVTVMSVLAGILIGLILKRRFRWEQEAEPKLANWPLMRWMGRVGLIVCAILRGQYAITHPASQYGRSQLSYSLTASIQSEVELAVLAALALVVISNLKLFGRPLQTVDAIALAIYVGASIYTGSRLSIIGPLIFLIWAYHTYVLRVSFFVIAALAVSGAALLLAIGLLRPTAHTGAVRSDAVGRALTDISSPLYVTNEVIRHVPSKRPYLNGSTYVAAAKRQLPGPISNRLFGPPLDTGAYQFRVIERDFNPNQGYSFALPAEGYLNFGPLGVLVAGLGTGLLFGLAWSSSRASPWRAVQIVYPLLVAALPLALRSDALTQSKLVITPLVATAVALAICRRIMPRSLASAPADMDSAGRSSAVLPTEDLADR